MTSPENHGTTADGTPLTDELIEAMADEAECGYDKAIRRAIGQYVGAAGHPKRGGATTPRTGSQDHEG